MFSVFTASAQKIINIETAQKGLYLYVNEDGVINQNYFGDRLLNSNDLILGDYNARREVYQHKPAFPTFGTGYTNEVGLKATHSDGNMTTRLVYDSHTSTKDASGNVVTTEIKLKDEYYPFDVTLIYKAYQKENVLTSSTVVKNNEKGDVKLEGVASNYLALRAQNYWLTSFYGSWAAEMKMVERKLEDGITVIDSKRGVRTTQDGSPTFILSLDQQASETTGEVIIGTLAWSGNYKLSLEIDNTNVMNITAGLNDFLSDYTLASGESFETPEMVYAHSSSGVGEASRNLHRYVRNYNIQDGDQNRPIVLNSWEGAYMKFDEQLIKKMIEDAASMGVEMFVLDDGWFGTTYPRDNDKAGLGDWEVNLKKLPNGIKALVDHSHKNGIKFGIWLEPEMVNPESILAKTHPDWIVTSPNREQLLMRTQLLLDLSNPDVQDFAYEAVAKVLRENPGVEYIKWDANRHVEDFGSSYLADDKQSHFWIDYINGLYKVYDRLTTDFPDVIFQACSSGGGRGDYGSMKYHHEMWGSDNTDGEWRVFINWGLSQFMPSQAIASHVSASPNHQTGHITPIKFRFDVALAQRLGAELQPKLLTEEELAWTKKSIEEYKQTIRPIVQHGDLYRLISPYSGTDFASMMYVTEDKSSSILFAYSLDYHLRDLVPVIKLQGLDADKNYMVKELLPAEKGGKPKKCFLGDGKVFSGDYLMKHGVTLQLQKRYDSAIFEIIAQ